VHHDDVRPSGRGCFGGGCFGGGCLGSRYFGLGSWRRTSSQGGSCRCQSAHAQKVTPTQPLASHFLVLLDFMQMLGKRSPVWNLLYTHLLYRPSFVSNQKRWLYACSTVYSEFLTTSFPLTCIFPVIKAYLPQLIPYCSIVAPLHEPLRTRSVFSSISCLSASGSSISSINFRVATSPTCCMGWRIVVRGG